MGPSVGARACCVQRDQLHVATNACKKGGHWASSRASARGAQLEQLQCGHQHMREGGHWARALVLGCVACNVLSYSGATSACKKGGHWELACITRSAFSHYEATSTCEKGGHWGERRSS